MGEPSMGLTTRGGGPLAVLLVGLGAVATTLVAGVLAARRGLGQPTGSFVERGAVDGVRVRALLDLAQLDELVFGAWDVFPDDAWQAARHAAVLEPALLDALKDELEPLRPWPAVFDEARVPRLNGPHRKAPGTRRALAEAIRADIRSFMQGRGCSRGVVLGCASTEVHSPLSEVHTSLAAFERGLDQDHPDITPTQLYVWAALMEGLPYANGAPNPSIEVPALVELAERQGVPVAGSDLKSGQTMLKTAIAPALASRQLEVTGWFSTNILGNRDGQVLAEPGALSAKRRSKSGVINDILGTDVEHQVHIHYYPPRGDNKESWDNIDLVGWMGAPMQLKVNFLCRDSILAAPLLLDLALLLDAARRGGQHGVLTWLSFYFKEPAGPTPTHALALQRQRLEAAVRELAAQRSPSLEPAR